MHVVVLFNGLGNQMSQYAFFLHKKSVDDATRVVSLCGDHNGLELSSVFGIDISPNSIGARELLPLRILANSRFPRILEPFRNLLKRRGFSLVNENFDYRFNPAFLGPGCGVKYFIGGWHHPRYFAPVAAQVRSAFQFKRVDPELDALARRLSATDSVAVHIRLGDYLNEENRKRFGSVCDIRYYSDAIRIMQAKLPRAELVLFSNDPHLAREMLPNVRFALVPQYSASDSWKDMYLMSQCKHQIVANSSFSWWAAWLNANSGKCILCPDRFINSDLASDIYPSSWIRVPTTPLA